jgi:hypothetical protein
MSGLSNALNKMWKETVISESESLWQSLDLGKEDGQFVFMKISNLCLFYVTTVYSVLGS